MTKKIGLIAGNGAFPAAFIKSAKQQGYEVFVVAHKGESDPAIEEVADSCLWVSLGQLKKIVSFFRNNDVSQVALLGGITRKNIWKNSKPDLLALKILIKAPFRKDDALLRAIAAEIEALGITIISPSKFLSDWVVKTGVLTERAPSETELLDAKIGWHAAEELGREDKGQAVVIRNGNVLAAEGSDGTDALLNRVIELGKGTGVIVKRPKPGQDKRLDLPAIGEKTIALMAKAGLTALILEENGAIVQEPKRVINAANINGISISVFTATGP